MDINDLSVRDLSAVVYVARHGHFGRAARALKIAQPTLSAQVQKVERSLGIVLFERSSRRFRITPEGQRLLPAIEETLRCIEGISALAMTSMGRNAPIRLGIIPTLGPYLAPHLLGKTGKMAGAAPRRQTPPDLIISEQLTSSLVDGLVQGTIDAALLSLPIGHDSLDSIPLFDEPFGLIALRGCPLLGRDRLTTGCLAARDMVLLEEGHCLRAQVLDLCGQKRREGGPKVIATSLETLKYVVASGGGYSLIPKLASDIPAALVQDIEVRSFDEQRPFRRVALCFRRSTPRRTEMIELAKWIVARLPKSVAPVGATKQHR